MNEQSDEKLCTAASQFSYSRSSQLPRHARVGVADDVDDAGESYKRTQEVVLTCEQKCF